MDDDNLEYKLVFIPPGVELQARRFAMGACSMMECDSLAMTVNNGELANLSYGSDGEGTRSVWFIEGNWYEVSEVNANDDVDGNQAGS